VNQVISQVVKICHSNLLKNKAAMAYLKDERKLTEEIINKFEIGLFPQDLEKLFSVIDLKDLKEAGIVKHATKSMFRMWDLVIPVKDVYGNYIALSGRVRISEKERKRKNISKYMNSVYKKSQHLFGLNLAKKSILKNGVVYVVEGPFDVITPHQKGMTNVVGVCGKYLSTRQVILLSRYTNKIVLILDNEAEAQEAANKIISKKQFDGISLVAKNPFSSDGSKDIDQYLKNHSVSDLMSILESKGDYGDIKLLWE
jgi:DNA primase